jgi:hypothetical protein
MDEIVASIEQADLPFASIFQHIDPDRYATAHQMATFAIDLIDRSAPRSGARWRALYWGRCVAARVRTDAAVAAIHNATPPRRSLSGRTEGPAAGRLGA